MQLSCRQGNISLLEDLHTGKHPPALAAESGCGSNIVVQRCCTSVLEYGVIGCFSPPVDASLRTLTEKVPCTISGGVWLAIGSG